MIILHGSRPRFGLPSASPFVTKVEILLKMAGLAYTHVDANFSRAPKGKIPFIEEDGKLLADSTFIRLYLEERHGARFDGALMPAEKGIAHAFQTMCEEHLYWAVVDARWMVRENFEKGPKHFFDSVPAPVRPLVIGMIHRDVKRNLKGQGLGRHARADIERLANRDIDALAAFLGDKPFLMGAEPCGADASVWAAVASVLCPFFETPIRTHAERHKNLIAYRDRGMERWFANLAGGRT